MEKFSFFLCAFFAPFFALAQATGPSVTVQFANHQTNVGVLVPKIANSTDSIYLTTAPSRTYYGVGGFARFLYDDLNPAYLQAELHFLGGQAQYELRDRQNNILPGGFTKMKYKLEIPFGVGIKLWPVHISGGIIPSFPMFVRGGGSSDEDLYSEIFESTHLDYYYGAGLSMWRITAEFRVTQSTAKFEEKVIYEGEKYGIFHKDRTFMLQIGFKLQKPKTDKIFYF